MSEKIDSKKYSSLLFQYDLYPERVIKKKNVLKVFTKNGTYALKKTKLTRSQAEWLFHVHERLAYIGYKYYIPLYRTKYGDPFVFDQYNTYYLMPWVEDDRHYANREAMMISNLAALHNQTVKEQEYSEEIISNSYQQLTKRWEGRQLEMERYIESVEKRVYLSPFEQSFVTNFHRLMHMTDKARNHLYQWQQKVKEKKRYRSVLCHGRVSPGHFIIHQGKGFFINFDHAVLDTPVRDLAYFLRSSMRAANWNERKAKDWFTQYQERFPLYEEEKSLLASYLTYPEIVFNSVDLYRSNRQNWPQIKHVNYLVKRIEQIEKVHKVNEIILARDEEVNEED
ncbi:spore coat protein YsxE [Pseudalkalibacillus caeni]|uniref:Spore coat protein YsxE n=1 Tax=Exobacillus caeni TaxID=2574798 RepID=A0A5R9F660_9BACL|nr:spore coat protein YsxE [Pseudalkalibacillus caeni]TLS39222.1 spore coat protein YsxE [Pseudalkalibacillus caeni]